jgi:hypothetical protein
MTKTLVTAVYVHYPIFAVELLEDIIYLNTRIGQMCLETLCVIAETLNVVMCDMIQIPLRMLPL